MSLQKLIASYMDESSNAVTQGTLDTYQHAFDRFLKFVRSRPVDKELLVEWMTSMLRVDKLSPCSVRGYRTVIAGFYNWAEDMGHVKDSPMPRRFRIPSAPSKKIPIRLEDYVKILEQCGKEHHKFWTYAVMAGWETGLRLSDIAVLRKEQVNLDQAMIDIIPSKTQRFGKRLEIPISEQLRDLIQSMLTESEYVCPTMAEWHAATQHRALSSMFGKVLKRAGIKKPGLSFHSFRHGLVTRLVEKGISSEIIAQITGQSVMVIMGYTRIDMDTKRRAMFG